MALKRRYIVIKVFRALYLITLGGVLLFALGLVLLQNPEVQTWLSGKIVDKVFSRIDGDVNYRKIHLKPFNTIVIKDLVIKDKHPYEPIPEVIEKMDEYRGPLDTLLAAEYVIVRFSPWGLLRPRNRRLEIQKAEVKNGAFFLVIEEGRTSLERMLKLPKDRIRSYLVDTTATSLSIHIDNVELDNMRYVMLNYKRQAPHFHNPGSVDWAELRCSDIRARGKDLNIANGVISGEMQSCSFQEKCGIKVDQVAARFSIREGYVNIEDILIRDQYSETRVPFFRMIYDGAAAFTDYVHKVRMYAKLDQTVVDTRTIDFFSDITSDEGLTLHLSGYFDGTVSDFQLKKMEVDMLEEDLSARLEARFTGLPFAERTRFDLRLADLQASDRAIERIIRSFGRQKIDLPTAQIQRMNFHAHGNPNDIQLNTQAESDVGTLALNGRVARLMENNKDGRIDLRLRTDGLRLDRLSGSDNLGAMDLATSLHIGLDKKDALCSKAAIDSIVVGKIGLLGYDYNNIDIRGEIADKAFNGTARIDDENLKFQFEGLATLLADESGAKYHFRAGIETADLEALGFDQRGRSLISLGATAHLDINEKREMNGTLDVNDIELENEDNRYKLGDIHAEAYASGNQSHIDLDSKMLGAHFNGSRSFLHFLGVSARQMLHLDPRPWDHSRYDLSIECRDATDAMAWLLPGISIANGSKINLNVSEEGDMQGEAVCEQFVIDDIKVSDIHIHADNLDERINGLLGCRKLDLGQFKIDSISLGAWAVLGDKESTTVGTTASHFTISEKRWEISPSQLQVSKEKGVLVNGFSLHHKEEGFFIQGKVAVPDLSDSLSIRMNQFDLELVSGFMGREIPKFKGTMQTGDEGILIERKNGHYIATGYITAVDCIFDSRQLGTLQVDGRWDPETKVYQLEINEYENSHFAADLSYHPFLSQSNKEDDFTLNAHFDGFEMGIFRSFVKDIFNRVDGQLYGLVTIDGNIKDRENLRLSSKDLRLSKAHLGIDYTQVTYNVESRLQLDNERISFLNAKLKDNKGAEGKLTGSILWNDFKQLEADLHIAVNKMELLNIKEKDKDQYSFYGHIFGSGNLDITGPFNAISLDVRANTTGIASDFNLTLENSSQNATSSLLKFKAPEPPEKKNTKPRKAEAEAKGDLTVKLNLDVTPDVTAHIDIDKFNGSRITANGNGRIIIDVRPSQDLFKLNGNYVIQEGKVRFVALGLTARDFTIKNDSSVAFGGDAMETSLNIDAMYKTKASLAAIIADSTAVSSRRVIECGIKVTDKLKNPNVKFSIDVPDLEPTVKTRVESALSTEDKLQRQFLALLVAGTFIPDEQGGVQDNTSALYSNVGELVSTQFNNIFMKLDIPLDLGFNYQPSTTASGASIFDVAVSTQLFNNRVVVNGNIGSKRRMTSGNNRNEVVGDIDIEVKINQSGTLRASAFSHSADQFTYYLDNLQRMGLGISWQQEFNHFGHYFRNLFTKRTTRSVLEQQEEAQRRRRGSKRVTITQ